MYLIRSKLSEGGHWEEMRASRVSRILANRPEREGQSHYEIEKIKYVSVGFLILIANGLMKPLTKEKCLRSSLGQEEQSAPRFLVWQRGYLLLQRRGVIVLDTLIAFGRLTTTAPPPFFFLFIFSVSVLSERIYSLGSMVSKDWFWWGPSPAQLALSRS